MTVHCLFAVEYWLEGDPEQHVVALAVTAPDISTARDWARGTAVKKGAVRTVLHLLSGPPQTHAHGFHISADVTRRASAKN